MNVTLKRPSALCKWNLIFKEGKCLREFLSDLEVLPNNPLNSDFDITSLTPNVDGNYEISYTLSYYFAKN